MKGSKACISGCVCALTINHPNSRSPIDIDMDAIERNSNNDDDDESIYPSRDPRDPTPVGSNRDIHGYRDAQDPWGSQQVLLWYQQQV